MGQELLLLVVELVVLVCECLVSLVQGVEQVAVLGLELDYFAAQFGRFLQVSYVSEKLSIRDL